MARRGLEVVATALSDLALTGTATTFRRCPQAQPTLHCITSEVTYYPWTFGGAAVRLKKPTTLGDAPPPTDVSLMRRRYLGRLIEEWRNL